jgi:hypothetical protein
MLLFKYEWKWNSNEILLNVMQSNHKVVEYNI